jgi:hypothetical protein
LEIDELEAGTLRVRKLEVLERDWRISTFSTRANLT